MSESSDADRPGRASVARAAGATHRILLPAVKLDLAVLLLALGCLWFAVVIATLPRWAEFLLLFGGSSLGALWLVWRTRRALVRARTQLDREESDVGP